MSDIYPGYKQELLEDGTSATSLLTSNIKMALVTSAYNSANNFLSDLTGVVTSTTTPTNMTGKSTTNGVFDCDDWTWPTVAGGSTVVGVVMYIDTGTAATSRLTTYLDSTNVSGLPLDTNGGDVNFVVDNAGLWGL